ncbi:MAG: HAD family phosphatase [Ferruginibacter sp.]
MSEIKNIIFDLGGVLLDIDYNKATAAFKRLGFADFEKMYSQYTADKLFEKLETGHINETSFYQAMIKTHSDISSSDIMESWNAMLLDFRLSSIEFLKRLRPKFRLFLLSNTNIIHQAAFNKLFIEQTGFHSLNDFFEIAWYSNEIGLRKPTMEIYQFILQDAAIKAEETFFIDDSYNNIETAKQLNFKTHLLVPGERIEDLDYNGYFISS